MIAPLPANETARLEALHRSGLLDSLPEQAYDDITLLASYICDTPMAMMNLVDSERQWFKSRVGIDSEETTREISFCAHAIWSQIACSWCPTRGLIRVLPTIPWF